MSKWPKVAFLTILLMVAGYCFGVVCEQFNGAYELLLHPSKELLGLVLRFVFAAFGVAVAAGLVAALVRPGWVGAAAFALSGASVLAGWAVSLTSVVLALVYVLAGAFCAARVAADLDERIRFSMRPISDGLGTLFMVLALLVCGGLYQGSAAYIGQEGFSVPDSYIEMVMDQMEKQIGARMPPGEREKAVAQFRQEFRHTVDDFFESTVKPYERFIPLVIAAGLFMSLVTFSRLLAWVPMAILGGVFPALKALGVTEEVSETQEVTRLVLS